MTTALSEYVGDIMDVLDKSREGEYKLILSAIEANYPAIKRDTQNFYKSQSQFMDNMLTVSAPTSLRNLRQILAEINKTMGGMREAYFGNRKKDIQIKQKLQSLDEHTGLERDLIVVEIAELTSQIDMTVEYMKGGMRKVAAYIAQYNNILASRGKTEFTEKDFEDDEERYHIMKAFEQGLCAARAHGGIIDEGNHIYFHQIGVNGSVAQFEVTRYLREEQSLIDSGREPSHEMTTKFLEYVAKRFKGCAENYSRRKGMTTLDQTALLK